MKMFRYLSVAIVWAFLVLTLDSFIVTNETLANPNAKYKFLNQNPNPCDASKSLVCPYCNIPCVGSQKTYSGEVIKDRVDTGSDLSITVDKICMRNRPCAQGEAQLNQDCLPLVGPPQPPNTSYFGCGTVAGMQFCLNCLPGTETVLSVGSFTSGGTPTEE